MMVDHEWPEARRKRGREDEYADVVAGGTLGFTEHRSKRLQSLPVRTSPTSKRWAEPPNFPPSHPTFAQPAVVPPRTITPGASDSEETAGAAVQQHIWAAEPELVVPQQPSPSGMVSDYGYGDMDMMDASSEPLSQELNQQQQQQHQWGGQQSDPQQQQQQQHLEPGPFQPDATAPTITGRMPTPIHCSFAQQVRGTNWSGAAGNVMQQHQQQEQGHNQGPAMMDEGGLNAAAFSRRCLIGESSNSQSSGGLMIGHDSVPRSLDGAAATAQVMADWSMVQNRRLPSPISENGGEDSPLSPQMMLDSSFQQQHMGHLGHLTHQHPLLSALPTRPAGHNHVHDSPSPEQRNSPGREGGGSENHAMDIESPATPSPGRKGHTRSRHTLSSWTSAQPGMKRSFSIGYRADCEKCRMKVPGHFNHIILS
ncbi:hypothetical protein B0H66DRAFT_297830 [Apodospora peruviana]|uniref:Uncharacterized protein n=1 Tax=Apodospora peruviana TaxID=516989 RepID=A0AAE0I165_9PEZI|nr:hypothetical protein B0H66DRAFT_297830 [Apodospora peruviana]